MVLYILTGYRVLSIVYLDQLMGACHAQAYYITILGFWKFVHNNLSQARVEVGSLEPQACMLPAN